MKCAECEIKIETTARYCVYCGKELSARERLNVEETKSKGAGIILSMLCPGLGQLYNGRILKGILMFIASVFFVIIFAVFGMSLLLRIVFQEPAVHKDLIYAAVALSIAIGLWIYGMVDASRPGKRVPPLDENSADKLLILVVAVEFVLTVLLTGAIALKI